MNKSRVRSYVILLVVMFVHYFLYFLVGRYVIFQSDQLSSDELSDGFQRIAPILVKPVMPDAQGDSSKVPPPAMNSITLVQASVSIPTIPVSTPVAAFSISIPKMQIPSLPDSLARGVNGSDGNGLGSGQGVNENGSLHSTNLLGMDVASEGPTVAFLDTSESLKNQRDAVEEQIKKSLPDCTIVEINGVVFSTKATLERLKTDSILSEYLADYYLSLVGGSIIPRVTDQIQKKQLSGPMTLYYFSDFEDYADRRDVDAFSQLLQDNHIRFYAYSVEKEPNDAIKKMCTDTGGSWKLKPTESP